MLCRAVAHNVPYLTCDLCLLGAFGGFGTTTTTAGPTFSFSAPTNTGTSGKIVQVQKDLL